jgi:ATP-dependent helicase/nuclease subunit B
LKQRDSQEVTTQDLGRLYHNLLEAGLKEVLKRRSEGDRTITLESAVERFIEKVGGALRNELMLGSARNRYLLDRIRNNLKLITLAQREILKRGLFRPQHVGITFGGKGKLPALQIDTTSGSQVMLHGKIDRIDQAGGSDDAAVIDYRMGASTLAVGMAMHGLSLQLLTFLLVLESNGEQLGQGKLDPAAAFYLPLIRRIEDVRHPSEAKAPSDPSWHLKLKPRGIFDQRCLGALDRGLSTGQSEVVAAFVKQDGTLGRRSTNDVTDSGEFRELLVKVRSKLGEIADGILSGKIDVTPYRLKDASPCSSCEYRSLCRFDPAMNKYNHLSAISREDALGIGDSNG